MASTINAKNTSSGLVLTPDASGQLELQTADTTRMTIDVNGNVGIGTSSPSVKLDVRSSGTAVRSNIGNYGGDNNGSLLLLSGSNSTKNWFIGNQYNVNGGLEFTQSTATGGTTVSSTPSMVIDSSGNVGIGTSSPGSALDVQATSGVSMFRLTATTGTNAVYSRYSNTGGFLYLGRDNSSGTDFGSAYAAGIWSTGAYPMLFGTNGTERMRIDSVGRVAIGTNTPDGSSALTISKGSDIPLFVSSTGTNDGIWVTLNTGGTSGQSVYVIPVRTAGALRGGIQWNGTNLLYNNLSDERLKDNITDSDSGLDKLSKIKVRSYDWKESGQHVDFGVIAQELEEIAPEAVSKGKDNEDGSINIPYAVDTSVLVPAMIKAIQELKAELDTVKAELAELKGAA